MQNTSYSLISNPAAKFLECQANETVQTIYPNSSTALTCGDGITLRFDAQGRISSLNSKDGNALKTFSYSVKGVLLEVCMQNYRLSRLGNEWTDGHQLFDIEISLDNLGVVTIIERSCAAITRLNPNGTFVIAVVSLEGKQSTIYHSGDAFRPIERIEYPGGDKRHFRFDELSIMSLLDEADGYWLKTNGLWMHYNALGAHDGLKALQISVDFNGTVIFHYVNDTRMSVDAFGQHTYTIPTVVAA
ncbi:MAG: hypothetical protein JST89_19470 [Cyanobacteria bacterium SZAS-4]|nr:hypothetical protein [Cyanobacteria bacterium SZAS-4]